METKAAARLAALMLACVLGPPAGATAPSPPAAANADGDAMERLRDRLAERLSATKAHSNASTAVPTMDIRVSAPATPATASKMAAAAPAVARTAARRAVEPQAPPPHWSYSGQAGPQAWGGLKPEFALCANGQRQSPIDIREGIAVDLEPVKFDYQPSAFSVLDNGHTVQVNLHAGNAIEVGGRRFELRQFHFHRPSEERIDGRQFEMSAHLVHQDAEGRTAVVALLMAKGPVHPVVQSVWANLPLEKHGEQRARTMLNPADLLPEDKRYYTYMGSLTTPPCSEGVQWIVMRSPVAASAEQIDVFSRLYPMNARPPQSAAGRRIMQSN
jgi:carbonic anhydrase